MNKYVSRGLWFTLFLGGLSLAGVGVANAAETSGDDGVASGSQAAVTLSVPVSLGGNGISLLGDSSSSGTSAGVQDAAAPAAAPAVAPAPAPAVAPAPAAALSTSGLDGVLSGTQAIADVSVPVTLAGNAVSVVGDSSSSDSSGGAAPAAAAPDEPTVSPTTSGSEGIASGTQAPIDAAVPVTVGGNAISVLGDSSSSSADQPGMAPSGEGSPGVASGSGLTTSGDDGILSGTQAPIAAAAPVTAGGNAISVLGDSSSSGSSVSAPTAAALPAGGVAGGPVTSGSDGVASGTQVPVAAAAPVTAGGNAISVLGDSSSSGSSSGSGDAVDPVTGATAGATTGGDEGILTGAQLPIAVALPVTVGGNAISVTGDASTDGAVAGGVPPTPTAPPTPTVPTASGASTLPAATAGTTVAATGTVMLLGSGAAETLAQTGSDDLGLGAIAALLALAGVVLMFGARNRTTVKRAHRIHNTK